MTIMNVACIVADVRSSTRRFRAAKDGNIAVIFAIALLPILSFIGAAIDYSRANSARTSMQAALDSAALMLSKDDSAGNLTASQLTAKAQAYFTALYNNSEATGVNITAAYSNSSSGAKIVLTGSGSIATDFMKIAGIPSVTFGTSSTTTWGTTKLRVAMALDNTGSMADDGKMPALITASKNLIDQLSASASTNGDVYISIVPFANVVNLGTSYVNSGYIDWSQWSTRGSIEEDYSCGTTNTSPTYQNGYNGIMKCGTANNNTTQWNGCVMDRGTASGPGTGSGPDVVITPPTSGSAYYFPADQSSYCPDKITPLSYNWSNLKSSIDQMSPSGGTNQPVGMVWAWQTLQQTAPFNAPAEDPNYVYKKVIILLSDGLNTMDRWYGNGSTQSTQVDARQKLLCDNIKAAGVTVYTIQVNTGGDPTSSILSYCASGSANFFMLTTASQVISTFNSIGTSLSKLRISK